MRRQLRQMLCFILLPLQAENARVWRRQNMEDYHGQTLQALPETIYGSSVAERRRASSSIFFKIVHSVSFLPDSRILLILRCLGKHYYCELCAMKFYWNSSRSKFAHYQWNIVYENYRGDARALSIVWLMLESRAKAWLAAHKKFAETVFLSSLTGIYHRRMPERF